MSFKGPTRCCASLAATRHPQERKQILGFCALVFNLSFSYQTTDLGRGARGGRGAAGAVLGASARC